MVTIQLSLPCSVYCLQSIDNRPPPIYVVAETAKSNHNTYHDEAIYSANFITSEFDDAGVTKMEGYTQCIKLYVHHISRSCQRYFLSSIFILGS